MSAVVQFPSIPSPEPDFPVLAAALDVAREGIALFEGERLFHANCAFAELLGYSGVEAMRGLHADELLPPRASPPAPGPHELEIAPGKRIAISAQAVTVRRREFAVVRICQVGDPAGGKSPESPGMEMLGRVVGGVAHDFNNLLTGILLYCDLLMSGLEPGSQQRVYVEEIRRAGGHSAGLIQQLLTLARTPSQPNSIGNGTLWSETVSGLYNLLTRLLGENVELLTDFAPDSAPVSLDPSHMRRLLLNLLLNARDAMPDGGRITVGSANCADLRFVELSVADNGCGMDAQTRSRMFETFYTTKASGRGAGLGMAIVAGIVRGQRGSLEVESAPGDGTKITVRLPRAGAVAAQNSGTQETHSL